MSVYPTPKFHLIIIFLFIHIYIYIYIYIFCHHLWLKRWAISPDNSTMSQERQGLVLHLLYSFLLLHFFFYFHYLADLKPQPMLIRPFCFSPIPSIRGQFLKQPNYTESWPLHPSGLSQQSVCVCIYIYIYIFFFFLMLSTKKFVGISIQ